MTEKRVGMEVSIAIAEAVKLAKAECIAAYPITPQTHIVEHLSELVADGELDAEFIPVESEHSALSVCAGTSAVGARTFTATSSQGLALMHEILFIVCGHAPAHRHGRGQPGPFRPAQHLERPQRRHGLPGLRLDPDLHRKRAGGFRPDHLRLQDCRRPAGADSHDRQPRRFYPEPRGGAALPGETRRWWTSSFPLITPVHPPPG